MKKIKISPKKIIFYLNIFISLFSVAILGLSTIFLYKNFYQTTLDSAELLTLQQKVAIEMVNLKKFNEIVSLIDHKTASSTVDITNNPFE